MKRLYLELSIITYSYILNGICEKPGLYFYSKSSFLTALEKQNGAS